MGKNFVNRATDGNCGNHGNNGNHGRCRSSETRRTSQMHCRANVAEAILAAIRGTNLCMITDDKNAPIVITEMVPYDIDFSELPAYLRSYGELDKKRAQLATLLSFCGTEPQLVTVADPEMLQDKFEAVCNACKKRGQEITGFLCQLDSETDRRILTERYLHGYDFDAIARMHCMREECVRLAHDTALEELYEIMSDAAAEAYMETC